MKTRLLTTFVALLATVFGASAAATTDEPVTDGILQLSTVKSQPPELLR